MALYPEVQQKAQTELDAVVGLSRLPVFGDRDALPYVNAVVKECFRWNATLPLGILSGCCVVLQHYRCDFNRAPTTEISPPLCEVSFNTVSLESLSNGRLEWKNA